MKWLRHISVLVIVLLSTASAHANPYSPTSFSDPVLRHVLETEGQEGGRTLTRVLRQSGFLLMSEEAIEVACARMNVLEPFILASQHNTARLDKRLHQEFSACASPAARDSMCTILRSRLKVPVNLLSIDCARASPKAGAAAAICLVEAAEVLSDYRDPLAAEKLTEVVRLLGSSPCESLWLPHSAKPPSWFVRVAHRRIIDPNSTEILLPRVGGSGRYRICRNASDIEALFVTIEPGKSATWHEVTPDLALYQRILTHLADGRDVGPLPYSGLITSMGFGEARMKIVFTDCCCATFKITNLGIRYTDNTRLDGNHRRLSNDALADDIWALLDQFEDLVEIW